MRRPLNILGIVSLILLGSGIFLLMPSKMEVRESNASKVVANSAAQATEQEMFLVKSTFQFVIPAAKGCRGDLYLFMPAQGNHIALASSPATNSFLKEYFNDLTIHVIPITEPDSPNSAMAMKLALNYQGAKGQRFIDMLSGWDGNDIEREWKSLPLNTQQRLNDELDFNRKISRQFGKNQTFMTFNGVTVKTKTWSDFIPLMNQVHKIVNQTF